MKKKALVEILKRISKEITDQIVYPNNGGCAVIAALVGQELAKHTQVQVVVQDYWSKKNLTRIRKSLGNNNHLTKDDWSDAGISFNHVLLKVKLGRKWRVFDSDGVVPYRSNMFVRGHMSVDEAIELAASKDWNWRFDRRQIPAIGRIVHNAFSGV